MAEEDSRRNPNLDDQSRASASAPEAIQQTDAEALESQVAQEHSVVPARWSLARYVAIDEVRGLNNLVMIFAEGLATFAFVFLATGVVVASAIALGGEMDAARLVAIALGFGISIAVLVAAFGPISGGHINPAVTFAMVVTGNMGLAKGLAYWVLQLAGAVLASFLLRLIVPESLEFGLGANGISDAMRGLGFTEPSGLVLEVMLTFFFVWVIFAVAIDRRGPWFGIAPIAIGLTLAVVHLLGVPFTGVSVNPARSLGPALATGDWNAHWIFWVGPLVGAALAGTLYEIVYGARSRLAKSIEELRTAQHRNER